MDGGRDEKSTGGPASSGVNSSLVLKIACVAPKGRQRRALLSPKHKSYGGLLCAGGKLFVKRVQGCVRCCGLAVAGSVQLGPMVDEGIDHVAMQEPRIMHGCDGLYQPLCNGQS